MRDIDTTINEQLTKEDLGLINIKFKIFKKVGVCNLNCLNKIGILKLTSMINDDGQLYHQKDNCLYKV